MSVDVIYAAPRGDGWGPVERLAQLAAQSLGGKLVRFDEVSGGHFIKARGLLPRTRRGGKALVIAAQPDHLNALLETGVKWGKYSATAGWVIDSFWWDRVPRLAKRGGFDRLYVTDPDDIDPWQSQVPCEVSCLPWGADVLAARTGPKTFDILRVGRQPTEWSDDDRTLEAANQAGLSFSGRPPFGASAIESQKILLAQLSSAKYVLAFSNLAHQTSYTHTSREYITARWTDSLAHGAVVAGISPKSAAAQELLWDGSCLDLESTSLEDGLVKIREACATWTPEVANNNHFNALERLDWRHRLRDIARDLSLPNHLPLTNSLNKIEEILRSRSSDSRSAINSQGCEERLGDN